MNVNQKETKHLESIVKPEVNPNVIDRVRAQVTLNIGLTCVPVYERHPTLGIFHTNGTIEFACEAVELPNIGISSS